MNDEARAHYDQGLALYAQKDYAAAIRELDAGYALDPRREFLFAEAQALRLSGDCKGAVPLYQKFLTSGPDEVQVNAAHIGLGRCAEQMASAPPAVSPPPDSTAARPTPTTTTVIPAAPPPPPPPTPAPWYHDAAGGALVAGGVLGIATGAAFTVAAMAARDDANHGAQTYPEYNRLWDTARSRAQIAIAAFATGTALTGLGIFRYLLVRGHHRAATPAATTVDAWVTPHTDGGAIAGIGGRF